MLTWRSGGRARAAEYLQNGYIPMGCSDADVSRSMNYWHSDYALSRAAVRAASLRVTASRVE